MTKPLRLVLTDHWFDEIKSGRKKSEYRLDTQYWVKRLQPYFKFIGKAPNPTVIFQKAYRKNPETMQFEIENIIWISNGSNTDLKTYKAVFEIKLGRKLK